MLMKKVSLLVLSDPGEPQLSMLDELRETANVVIGNSADAFRNAADSAEVIFNWSGSLSLIREVFLMSHAARWVHSRSAGLERTLFPELIASNVTMTNGSGVFSPSLGEFALGAILYFAKDFRRMIRNQMAGVWEPFDVLPVSGQTVGIVGYGDIGRAVATRVRAMGMKVLAVKRHVSAQKNPDPLADKIYGPDHLIEMLSLCDYVVVAAPLNAETNGMIGEAEFAAMKPSGVIINVGRGPVIEEQAMIRALSEHKIKGAALDVFAEEPLPKGHPFYKLENVLLSPHCADHTPDWLANAMRFFIAQFERFRRGEPLLNVVDKKLGY
jgi:phosphoglycerate dehydrogenase-like enzyme